MSRGVALWDRTVRLKIKRPRHQVVWTGEGDSWKQGRGCRTDKARTVPGDGEEVRWTGLSEGQGLERREERQI